MTPGRWARRTARSRRHRRRAPEGRGRKASSRWQGAGALEELGALRALGALGALGALWALLEAAEHPPAVYARVPASRVHRHRSRPDASRQRARAAPARELAFPVRRRYEAPLRR